MPSLFNKTLSSTCEEFKTVAADVTLDAAAALRLEIGTTVWCAVKATDLDAYPA